VHVLFQLIDLGTTSTSAKPLSAIAAARLKAEAAVEHVAALETIVEPVPLPDSANPLPQSPVAEPEDSEQDDEPMVLRQNVKLCTWRNDAQNIMSDTEKELTVKLNKHTTIALIGCFRFKVLRGAVNVNGANIGAMSRDGQQDQVYTAYVPATHPIAKFRGLDGMNHVQFLHCADTSQLASAGPLFEDIWHAGSRSFSVVSNPAVYDYYSSDECRNFDTAKMALELTRCIDHRI
jgi:polynucleotide 5'-hydroxyl-kinase GRC3/NOL9